MQLMPLKRDLLVPDAAGAPGAAAATAVAEAIDASGA